MATYREFGIKDEATPQDFDTLGGVAPNKTIPDADTFWPVTGGDYAKNEERVDRNNEARGRRAASAPRSFRASPQMTVPVRAYPSIVKKALRKTLGGADTVTGMASPYTHALAVVGQTANVLPTVTAQLVRDDLNHKLSAASFNRASMTFPLDGEGTCEFELFGLFGRHDASAPPTTVFTGTGINDDVFMLRDAEVNIDGSVTPIADLQGFDFSFTNNLTRKFFAKKNVVTQVLGTPTQTKKLWWPSVNKLSAAQDVTYRLAFGNVNAAQDLAQEYAQIQKLVFNVLGAPITGGTEILRVTIYGGVHTGGGAEALSAREDITQSHDGGAFYSESDGKDILVELVDSVAAPIT
jgi:hypothetical protein